MKWPKRLPTRFRLRIPASLAWLLGRPAASLLITLTLLPLVATGLLNIIRLPATFTIHASTEVLEIVTSPVSSARWYIRDGMATLGSDDPLATQPAESQPFSGYLDIGPRVHVHLVRYANGPLELTVQEHSGRSDQNGNGASEVARPSHGEGENIRAVPVVGMHNLLTEQASPAWPDSATLTVNAEAYPLNGGLLGAAVIGSETYATDAPHSPPVLRDGRVVVLGKSLISDERFPVLELPLKLGDEVRVLDAQGTPTEAACVFSASGENDGGIDVACHANGRALQVSRFGTLPYPLQPSLWAYLKADPVLQTLLALIGSVMLALFQYLLNRVRPRLGSGS